MRLQCFCNDCRGYYQFRRSQNPELPDVGLGGFVDYTQVGPGDVEVLEGREWLRVAKLRSAKGQARVYASCCNTPLFSHGMSIMLYSFLIPEDKRGPVDWKIIGRDATGPIDKDVYRSVPLSWPFAMIGRLWSEKKEPVAFDVKAAEAEIVKL
jgi:hypothetical protein